MISPAPYVTLTDLWHGACSEILWAPTDVIVPSGLGMALFDVTLRAESMQYELDVSRELWMTAGRFTTLQRDYLEREYVERFVRQSAEMKPAKKIALSQMMCRVKPKNHPLKFRWGNCILGTTFRIYPEPVFSMHARTCSITRMGGLDLALAYCLAKLIADARGENVEDYGFIWHIDCMQHSSMNGLPYFYSHGFGDLDLSAFRGAYPAMNAMRRQLEYFDDLDERGVESKFGTRRRIREQRRAFIEDPIEFNRKRGSVPLSRLNLDPVLEDR